VPQPPVAGLRRACRDHYSPRRHGDRRRHFRLLLRLRELNDYGFFSAAGSASSPLEISKATIIRIHSTQNESLQNAFSSFVLQNIYQSMFARGEQRRLTHALVIDEAHRASRLKLIPTLAKECRKYGILLIIASQEARDFQPSLFSAVGNYLALRVTDQDAKVLASQSGDSASKSKIADRLKQMPKYHANHERKVYPNLSTPGEPPASRPQLIQQELSATSYGPVLQELNHGS
jgi:DNA helicase HerA-like ATPase